jgi:hypothetical protein
MGGKRSYFLPGEGIVFVYIWMLEVDILWRRSDVFLKVWILKVGGGGFLFWFLTLTREIISTEFDTFCN